MTWECDLLGWWSGLGHQERNEVSIEICESMMSSFIQKQFRMKKKTTVLLGGSCGNRMGQLAGINVLFGKGAHSVECS